MSLATLGKVCGKQFMLLVEEVFKKWAEANNMAARDGYGLTRAPKLALESSSSILCKSTLECGKEVPVDSLVCQRRYKGSKTTKRGPMNITIQIHNYGSRSTIILNFDDWRKWIEEKAFLLIMAACVSLVTHNIKQLH